MGKFYFRGGPLFVLMPEIPADKTETTPSEHGPYTTHLFIVKEHDQRLSHRLG